MLEITNKTKSPVQLLVRSKKSNTFTCLNVPGIGKNKNIIYLEDERKTEYIDRIERSGLIKIRYISGNINKERAGEQ